jgi:hypothetical protein
MLYSTVLFVNGSPVGYQVERQNGQFFLNPAENPTRKITPPIMRARIEGGKWFIEGTGDQDLIDQVIYGVANNESKIPHYLLSAAP